MEPVGFAAGIISLAALFDTCIELADYISLANNLGRDYETSYTRFLLLKARLCAWKPCMNVLEHATPKEKYSEERMLVGRSLIAIKALLEDGQKLETKYGLRGGEDFRFWENTDNKHGLSESLIELEYTLGKSASRRQQKTSWNKKFQWAIRDRKGFDRLIGDLSFHVDELEKLASRLNIPITGSIQRSIRTITSPATIQLLEEAVETPDIEQSGTATDRHVYIRNQVAEHARAYFGNIGIPADAGDKHYYAGNQVCGNARVVFGNGSVEAMAQFFGP